MKKDELTALGLTDEQADKVLAINGRDIEKHKRQPKTRKPRRPPCSSSSPTATRTSRP